MMIPYPCWLPFASAVRIMKVASCIARTGMQTLYTAERAIASPAPRSVLPSPAHREPGSPRLMTPGLVYEDVERGRCKGSPIPPRLAIMGRLHRAPRPSVTRGHDDG